MRLAPAPGGAGRVPFPIVFGAITLIASAAAWLRIAFTADWIPSPCIFRRLTGIPCPACHATRALAELLAGKPGAALALNPLVVLLALGSVGAALASAARRIAGRDAMVLEFGPREELALRAGAVLLLAANWIYLVARR